MERFIERLEQRLNLLHDKLDEQGKTLLDIRKDLNYHIFRTDALEDFVKEQEKNLKIALLPILWLKMTAKVITWVIPILAAISSAYYYFFYK